MEGTGVCFVFPMSLLAVCFSHDVCVSLSLISFGSFRFTMLSYGIRGVLDRIDDPVLGVRA
jgi:hypothetical protein